MQVPLRLLQAARPSVEPALLVAIASSTAVFTATPFVLAPIADEFGVSIGAAGLMSTAQLAGFVISSWAAGRFLRPVRRAFIAMGVLGLVANLLSAIAPTLILLAACRFASGVSLGMAAWFGWQAAFGDSRKTGDVAVIGPLVGVALAPAIASLLDVVGLRWLFVILAFVAAAPLAFANRVSPSDRLREHTTRHAATRAARMILVALGLITLGGSSVFVYAAAIGTELVGLSAVAVSLGFSANSLVAIPAAKWAGPRGPAGFWFGLTGVLALLIATVHDKPVFLAALVGWGFVFFMGIPAAFALLSSRSRFPEERAGDAQAVMAAGRVFGPIIGGAFIAADQTTAMGVAACSIMVLASTALVAVELRSLPVTRAPVATTPA